MPAPRRTLSLLPRPTAAASAARAPRALSRRRGLPTAWWGMMIFIASEATLFARSSAATSTCASTRSRGRRGACPSRGCSSRSCSRSCSRRRACRCSSRRARRAAGRVAAARLLVVAALVVQSAYLAYEIHDYRDQLHASGITRDAYSSIYYTLLGADHAHVALGILFDVWLLAKLARGLTTYRANATQAIAWYWHAVNLATLVVIATLLSARA